MLYLSQVLRRPIRDLDANGWLIQRRDRRAGRDDHPPVIGSLRAIDGAILLSRGRISEFGEQGRAHEFGHS